MKPSARRQDRTVERRCCTALLAVWNHLHGGVFVEVPQGDDGHRRIDLAARDRSTGALLLVEHGLLLTFDESRGPEKFVRERVAPVLRAGIGDRLRGHTVVRIFVVEGTVPRDAADRLLLAFRLDPKLLDPGARLVADATGALASVRVDAVLRRATLIVGPVVSTSRDAAIDDLRRRLAALVGEERQKYLGASGRLGADASHARVLLVEADDVWNLADRDYVDVFDSASSEATRTGLRAMWRVAADSADEVQLWQEWDAECPVPPRRRFFRWVERDGSVHEV